MSAACMASASADAEQRGDGPATLIDVDDKTGLAVRVAPLRLGGVLSRVEPPFWVA